MSGQDTERTALNEQAAEAGAQKERVQSSIQFPYGDLETAVAVADAMHSNGYRECAPDQLAAAMGQHATSGNFRQKVASARIFGLIETAPGRIALTDLGGQILDPAQEKRARVSAFLHVELYRRLYEDHRSRTLPPRPAGLERTFEQYGVSGKQTDKARQAFDRSARQAGFFVHGNDRLVMPGGLDSPNEAASERLSPAGPASKVGVANDGAEALPPGLDPLIVALLRKMPTGPGWPLAERAKWLQALAMNLSFVYEADGHDTEEIHVSIQSDSLKAL